MVEQMTSVGREQEGESVMLYSAQLHLVNGQHQLLVTDAESGHTDVIPVTKKAVSRLPTYLGMLKKAAK
ncbi:hypothetical protein E0L36_17085 [Streptomyces sp. AJS327]|uniref:hypothetical protein n=1 Tax=Streptomyces sp. AJS327 TaxID=2545265 RepID=UPI0015DDB301|nr:hypothetical protein [Streptomyces sp. AJS327]MBA0052535.1 hypothetical protein [Streptomyces sp. AJS327]